MGSLLVVLWAVYLSECLAGARQGEWVFKGRGRGAMRGTAEADLLLGGKRFARLPFAPWHRTFRCGGTALDVAAAAEWIRLAEEAVRPLRIAASVLFVALLPVLSLLVWTDRTAPLFVPWGALTLAAWGVSGWLFRRAYRRVHGRRPPVEVAVAELLSPIALARGALAVCWSAPVPAHPLAVAAVLCDDSEFLRTARIFRFDEPGSRQAIDELVAGRRLTAALRQGPEPEHPILTRYCPRCYATYKAEATRCADCVEVSLLDLQP